MKKYSGLKNLLEDSIRPFISLLSKNCLNKKSQ